MGKVFSLTWLKSAPVNARRSLVAASLGWMLDAFDIMLFAMVLSELIKHFGMTRETAGLLGSLTLVASAIGGFIFGLVADRFGRKSALMASILVYSVFTAACGFSTTVLMLAIFRILLGLGMGGEWASGAALVSETWPAAHRGKALGIVQSSWAVGYGAAAAVCGFVLPLWGWRAAFFIGVLPAFFTLWVRRKLDEPEIWKAGRQKTVEGGDHKPGLADIFKGSRLRVTILLTLMNALTMFGWWGLNLWIPAYLSTPQSAGGAGLSAGAMSGFVVFMQVGMWLGYVSFGFLSDRFGRKISYMVFLLAAAAFILIYSQVRSPAAIFILGPFVAYFGTGYFSGFGALTAEIFPTSIRATAQGITYNSGRIVSAIAPFAVGSLAQSKGFDQAFVLVAAAFLAAAVLWIGIPETKGRELE